MTFCQCGKPTSFGYRFGQLNNRLRASERRIQSERAIGLFGRL
jgi:hypothetical protein